MVHRGDGLTGEDLKNNEFAGAGFEGNTPGPENKKTNAIISDLRYGTVCPQFTAAGSQSLKIAGLLTVSALTESN